MCSAEPDPCTGTRAGPAAVSSLSIASDLLCPPVAWAILRGMPGLETLRLLPAATPDPRLEPPLTAADEPPPQAAASTGSSGVEGALANLSLEAGGAVANVADAAQSSEWLAAESEAETEEQARERLGDALRILLSGGDAGGGPALPRLGALVCPLVTWRSDTAGRCAPGLAALRRLELTTGCWEDLPSLLLAAAVSAGLEELVLGPSLQGKAPPGLPQFLAGTGSGTPARSAPDATAATLPGDGESCPYAHAAPAAAPAQAPALTPAPAPPSPLSGLRLRTLCLPGADLSPQLLAALSALPRLASLSARGLVSDSGAAEGRGWGEPEEALTHIEPLPLPPSLERLELAEGGSFELLAALGLAMGLSGCAPPPAPSGLSPSAAAAAAAAAVEPVARGSAVALAPAAAQAPAAGYREGDGRTRAHRLQLRVAPGGTLRMAPRVGRHAEEGSGRLSPVGERALCLAAATLAAAEAGGRPRALSVGLCGGMTLLTAPPEPEGGLGLGPDRVLGGHGRWLAALAAVGVEVLTLFAVRLSAEDVGVIGERLSTLKELNLEDLMVVPPSALPRLRRLTGLTMLSLDAEWESPGQAGGGSILTDAAAGLASLLAPGGPAASVRFTAPIEAARGAREVIEGVQARLAAEGAPPPQIHLALWK
ncbi:hypothetical protein HYH03_014573 [Edaphochlamys debaryana]|uniref:Uncharacterized protein n=1 Tax=Edaphochlamys debaryana TaxID=47281 RepID=A0A836BTF1_9CHLO|nr:hypothetical protein HYH03_014573 [Edaphochlamys debaryana]|eukprot:KAG2486774.1 hypothetical protein HYH03_014573 [Edaphochlamys debaryana]